MEHISNLKMRVTILFIAVFAALASAAPKTSEKQFRNLYRKPVPEGLTHPGRIVNGDIAVPHSIPYQAFLQMSSDKFGTWYCGGSLIKPKVVLTAAHCFIGASTTTVILGAQRPFVPEDSQLVVNASKIISHAEFDDDHFLNDIALIILPSEVILNDYIQLVRLPKNNPTYEGQVATVSGWGLTDGLTTEYSDELRFTQNPVISNEQCNKLYGVVLPTHICISGDGGRSSCDGDSGGPLTIGGIQIGVVAYGSSGCRAGYPSAFTRVGSYLDWIEENSS